LNAEVPWVEEGDNSAYCTGDSPFSAALYWSTFVMTGKRAERGVCPAAKPGVFGAL